MRKKYLEKYLWSTRFVQHLPVLYMVSMLIFQFSVFLIHLLVFVLFHNPMLLLSLDFPLLLAANVYLHIYIYIFNVIPYNYLGHIFLWLNHIVLLIWTRSHCHAPITERVDLGDDWCWSLFIIDCPLTSRQWRTSSLYDVIMDCLLKSW
jgi:hypothetical protein